MNVPERETEKELIMQPKTSWRYITGNFLSVFIPLTVLFSVFLLYVYSSETALERKILDVRETSQIDSQLEIIADEFQTITSDLMVIGSLNSLQEVLNGKPVGASGLEADLRSISVEKKMYDQIRYLDDKGFERVRINFNNGKPSIVPPDRLQNKRDRYYFKDTFELDKGEIFVSPLDLNIEHGRIEQPIKPMIRFGTPVFSAKGDKKGIVLLNYFGSRLVDKMQKFSLDALGRFSFVNPEGYWLKGPNPDDEWGFMYENRKDRIFGNTYPRAWEKIISADSGQFSGESGLFTFTTFYPLTKNQVSSTGSDKSFSPSRREVKSHEYFFKIISHVPNAMLKKKTDRILHHLLYVYAAIMLLICIISDIFAYFRETRRKINLEKDRLIYDLEKALLEIKTLRGIVPICSYCNKIRDDEGFWSRVETYVEKYTEAAFSHGICPDCAREHFPDMVDEPPDKDDPSEG